MYVPGNCRKRSGYTRRLSCSLQIKLPLNTTPTTLFAARAPLRRSGNTIVDLVRAEWYISTAISHKDQTRVGSSPLFTTTGMLWKVPSGHIIPTLIPIPLGGLLNLRFALLIPASQTFVRQGILVSLLLLCFLSVVEPSVFSVPL